MVFKYITQNTYTSWFVFTKIDPLSQCYVYYQLRNLDGSPFSDSRVQFFNTGSGFTINDIRINTQTNFRLKFRIHAVTNGLVDQYREIEVTVCSDTSIAVSGAARDLREFTFLPGTTPQVIDSAIDTWY